MKGGNEGGVFWGRLVEKLKLDAESPKRPITCCIDDLANDVEHQVKVDGKARIAQYPGIRLTYTNLFYKPGDDRIRCVPLDGEGFELVFVAPHGADSQDGEGRYVKSTRTGEILTVNQVS